MVMVRVKVMVIGPIIDCCWEMAAGFNTIVTAATCLLPC